MSIVERVKKIYLFEPDDKWLEPLYATFAPWLNKVEIIPKYLSNIVTENTTTIDECCKNKEFPTFIKMDIEGSEYKALIGAKNAILSGTVKKIAATVYHYQDDEIKVRGFVESLGYTAVPSEGYITVHLDTFQPPYFRKVLLRCLQVNI